MPPKKDATDDGLSADTRFLYACIGTSGEMRPEFQRVAALTGLAKGSAQNKWRDVAKKAKAFVESLEGSGSDTSEAATNQAENSASTAKAATGKKTTAGKKRQANDTTTKEKRGRGKKVKVENNDDEGSLEDQKDGGHADDDDAEGNDTSI